MALANNMHEVRTALKEFIRPDHIEQVVRAIVYSDMVASAMNNWEADEIAWVGKHLYLAGRNTSYALMRQRGWAWDNSIGWEKK